MASFDLNQTKAKLSAICLLCHQFHVFYGMVIGTKEHWEYITLGFNWISDSTAGFFLILETNLKLSRFK